MGYLKFLKESFQYITVEPLILLFFWSIPYIDHGNGVLLFNKFCYEVYSNETFCELVAKYKDHYEEQSIRIQSQTSRYLMLPYYVHFLARTHT